MRGFFSFVFTFIFLLFLSLASEYPSQVTLQINGTQIVVVNIPNPTANIPITSTSDSTKSSSMMNSLSKMITSKAKSVSCNSKPIAAPPSKDNNQFLPHTPYVPKGYVNNYGDLLGYSMLFYEAQRGGILPNTNRVPWRNSSTLTDGFDNCIDLTGGYYDAGDYLKFTFPLASSMSFIAWGGIEFSQGYANSGQLGYLEQMMRWGFDWLIKAHPSKNVLYVQVGDGNIDNNYWGGDLTIPLPRPSFAIDMSNPGTDVAAGTAAAFAAGSILFNYRLNDPKYGATLLQHAIDLYNFAETAPKELYQNSVSASSEWYASSDYGDELVWGALWLYRATGDPTYLNKADKYFSQYSLDGNSDAVDWDSKYGSLYILGAQITAPGLWKTTTNWLGQSKTYLDKMLKQKMTPGGLLWFNGQSSDASLVAAINTSFMWTLYATLLGDSSRTSVYLTAAQSQIDYVLGKNPNKRPYVVGVSSRSPKNPQSAPASGGNDIGNIDNSPEVEAYVIYGAVVGGPGKDDSFQDKRSNWKQSEVAIDYNAGWSSMMAFEVMTSQVPYYVAHGLT